MKKLKKIGAALVFCAAVIGFASCKTEEGIYYAIEVPEGTASSYNTSAFVKEMGLGFNLGNYLDATSGSGLNSESSWRGGQKITKEMVTTIKDAGIKSVRIPVSWSNHIIDKSTNAIDPAWMARVKEVVDYAISQDLKVIINIHHDNKTEAALGYSSGYAITIKDKKLQEKSVYFIQDVWTQIANTFKSYDTNLVYELLNEPRCIGDSKEWGDAPEIYSRIITYYEQVALNAIRNIAGDKDRYISVPSYAAGTSDISKFSFPVDYVEDRLIFAFHAYAPYDFAMKPNGRSSFTSGDKSEISGMFRNVDNVIHGKRPGIGIIIGEMGATNRENLSDREAWFEYYVGEAYGKYGWPCFIWDNGQTKNKGGEENYGFLNPRDNTWFFPTLIEKAVNATK